MHNPVCTTDGSHGLHTDVEGNPEYLFDEGLPDQEFSDGKTFTNTLSAGNVFDLDMYQILRTTKGLSFILSQKYFIFISNGCHKIDVT